MLELSRDGLSNYTVVRPELCDTTIKTVTTALRRAIMTVGGIESLDISDDFEDAVPHEILIGDTNRPETAQVKEQLGNDDYRIQVVGEKLVIVGRDDAATAAAVRYFLREVLGYRSVYDYTPQSILTVRADLCASAAMDQSNTAADPRNPDDVLIYAANVLDFGAVGDGATDDTKAFQAAIDHVYSLGGGTVYAPAGQYLINGTLTVKRSVYLAGAWSDPDTQPDQINMGTVLLATGNRGKADATPLISVGASAGVLGLTVYYPEQSLADPVAYPAAFLILDSLAGDGTQHAASIQNVTVVNGWRGIAADQGNQLPRIDRVYLSVLDYGFRINGCYDCARVTSLHISPAFWAAYAGESEDDIAAAMKKSATGVILMRTDGQMMYDLTVRSCHTGISLERDPSNSGETAGYTNIVNMTIADCTVGIHCEYNALEVTSATLCCTGSNAVCLEVTDTANGNLRFYDCIMTATEGVAVEVARGSTASITIQSSQISAASAAYAVQTAGSVIMLCNNDFSDTALVCDIAQGTQAAVITGNKYTGELKCALDADNCVLQASSAASLPAPTDTSLSLPAIPPTAVAGTGIFDVTDYGAKGDGKTDDTKAIKDAIAAAKAAGGGIVYLPAGYYLTTGTFTLPSGVELRGIHESMHSTTGEGSVLYVTAGQGDAEGTPFITMEKDSSLRGLTFWYPEQAWNDIRAYPWTVSVKGKDCVLRNLCFGNAYRAIDMASADCGGHYVDNVTGCVLERGIALDGSSSAGVLMNTHFNSTFYYAVWGTKLTDASGDFGSGNMAATMLPYANAHLTAFSFGETTEEQMLFIFNYRARYGLDFTGGFEGKIIGCSVDGSLCGVRIIGDYDEDLVLVNLSNDLVPGKTDEGNVGIYIDISEDSTVRIVASGVSSYNYVPSDLLLLKNGTLVLDSFRAGYTPAGGQGAIRIQGGTATLSGVEFNHRGPLASDGSFTDQPDTDQTVDIRVDEDGTLDLYSAVGRRFFHDHLDGTVGEYSWIVTE